MAHLKRQKISKRWPIPRKGTAYVVKAGFNTKEGLKTMRGRFQEYNGIKVMPTYHPETLIKDPGYKRSTWEDVQKIMAVLGL